MLSYEQIIQLQAGPAQPLGTVAVGQTAGYSKFVIPPHTLVRISANDPANVRLCREYIYGAELGRSGFAPFEEFYASDDNLAVAAAGITDAWTKSGFVNQPQLLRAGVVEDGELKIFQDESDGEIRFKTGNGARAGKTIRAKIAPAAMDLIFRVRHDDDDALETIDYQIRELRRSATDQTKYWDDGGGAWTTTLTWNTITGSASEVTFTATLVVDETGLGNTPAEGNGGGSIYDVALSSTDDYAAGFTRIFDIGLHELITAEKFDARIPINGEVYLYSHYWSRVGGISDANTKLLQVSRMGQ